MYLNQIVIKYILLFFTDVVAYIEMVYSIFIDVSLSYVYILLNKNKNTVKKLIVEQQNTWVAILCHSKNVKVLIYPQ